MTTYSSAAAAQAGGVAGILVGGTSMGVDGLSFYREHGSGSTTCEEP